MPNRSPIFSQYAIFIILSCIMCSLKMLRPWPSPFPVTAKLRTDPRSVRIASKDYGNIIQEKPTAVLYPTTVDDILHLIKFSNNCSTPFRISARGCGHSVRGQAMAPNGVVVDMSSLRDNVIGVRVSWHPLLGYYADVGGEQLWIDVLHGTLEHGLAPVSWTDYLHLTVGGTLSNAGISGQSFLYGPQISNVLELDVITGKGDFVSCSPHINSELFFAVLGGLGQFGIITRARIVLEKAPTKVKWVRLIYTKFSTFTRDQEYLISTDGPNYVEGSIITHMSPPNNWRSSFYTSSDHTKVISLLERNNGLLYSIDVVKYYDDYTANTIDEELKWLVKDLNYEPNYIFQRDIPFTDFLSRVGKRDDQNSEVQTEAHPWLNLFVPKSRIHDFNAGVFVDIIRGHNETTLGPVLFYPFHRKKPEEVWSIEKLNNDIIEFCEKAGIKIIQYLPYYKSKKDWIKHFGPKWSTFQERKNKFDPRMILSPGQRIFTSVEYLDM
ncbi:Proteins containing the FAD binding domain [Handroanthus impetiginosus]|uniref:cytokinin dehydrogenase n=1 Tax=Handroanthus impetiginosus TaxID=429701 RepID=A0A2G9HIK8_9LAMI|nr:Proteins containing the FAD binding domain [Handroanthus impetiginosus]